MSFQKVLDKYREFSFSERDKGDRFERLIQAYLQTDPTYSNILKYVWMWNEFPGKKDFGGKDTGIDLVALTIDGDYWAIQCKCYKESGRIDKAEVDSFLSTSSRHFKNDQLQSVGFEKRIWVSTTNNWSNNAEETIRNQTPPVTRINLTDLQQAPVNWVNLEKGITGDLARTTKKSSEGSRCAHQKLALTNTHDHFKDNDRGQLIMACGTGKTFNGRKDIWKNRYNELYKTVPHIKDSLYERVQEHHEEFEKHQKDALKFYSQFHNEMVEVLKIDDFVRNY